MLFVFEPIPRAAGMSAETFKKYDPILQCFTWPLGTTAFKRNFEHYLIDSPALQFNEYHI